MKLKTFLMTAVALLVLSACNSKHDYETVDGDPMQTRIYTLDNGLKIYLSVNKEEPRVQTYIAVRTGSKNDPAETTGLAHYLEHLMFKGTNHFGVTDPEAEAPYLEEIEKRYEAYRQLTDPDERRQAYHEIDSVSQLAAQYFIPNEYDKMMSAIGAEGTNAFTSQDVTCYVNDIPSNEIENWAKVESDRFQNMVIRGFHTELEAVYEEYNIYLAMDQTKQEDAMMGKLFPNHPYGTQTTIGTQEHLKNPSITNIKNYFKKWYVPNNVAICMSGDFDPDEVVEIIKKYFGEWKAGVGVEQPTFGELSPIDAPQDTTVVGQEAENLWLGWRAEAARSLQCDTLQVIESMLSNGTAGLLDLNINQQMKMLGAGGGLLPMMDHSTFILAGTPREGQSLDEVRALLLEEIAKLKKGEFSDDLLPSVINNMKLQYYNSLESNRARAHMFMDAFINGTPWEQEVGMIQRLEGMTKEQIVAFANNFFQDNYITVYKRQGIDTNQKKIDKPEITPIPTNRDQVSPFVTEIQNAEVKPIEPRFVDFKKDLVFGNVNAQLPYVYVKNQENGRFSLVFRYEFGSDFDKRYEYAADYLEYVGTDSLTAEQLKQQFYKLACNYNVSVGSRSINISLNGLSENMSQAIALLDHVLTSAQADPESYYQFVALREKSRQDNKHDQSVNFSYLTNYGIYGPYNALRNEFTAEKLAQEDPQQLLDLLKTLSSYQHTVLYYGPMTESELCEAINDNRFVAENLQPVPQGKHYAMQLTPENEILIAPYDAKNIYMQFYHIEGAPYNPDEAAVKALFNQYYGGSMGSIVFQEIREARGLAYNAYAGYLDPDYKDEYEYCLAHVITQNDKMMDCLDQFHVILDEIPQDSNSFQIAKESVAKRIASMRTTKFGIINAWINARDLGIDFDENQRIYEALPALTIDDVVKFAKEKMSHKTYRYVILGDEKELDMKGLQQYGPVKRLTTEEIFGY